jgi:hypothetical protein
LGPGMAGVWVSMIQEIDKAKNLRKKAALLKVFAHSRQDLPALKDYLELEIRKSHNKEWVQTCRKWHVWVDNNLSTHLVSFDPVEFLIQMESNRPLKEKVYLINQYLKEIKPEHQEIIGWFEARLESNHAALRKVAKQVLDTLGKLGVWQEKKALYLQPCKSGTLREYQKAGREEKLKWLQTSLNAPESSESLFEWGIGALCMESDPFVVSSLIKVLPPLLAQAKIPLSRFLLILESFLWDEDPRMRANVLEGLGTLIQHEEEGSRIREVLSNFLVDPDVRVRTTALLAMDQVEPTATTERVEFIFQIAYTQEDFDSVHWLISQAARARRELEPLADLALERLEEWKLANPDEHIEISETPST